MYTINRDKKTPSKSFDDKWQAIEDILDGSNFKNPDLMIKGLMLQADKIVSK